MSKIEWTQQTWNPIVGCSIVSPGCTNCYAMKMAARLKAMSPGSHYKGTTRKVNGKAVWTGKLALAPDETLLAPLRRKKPTIYFVNSMGDLFHEDVPDAWIDKVFAVMALCPQHKFQVLTKRSTRMREYVKQMQDRWLLIEQIASDMGHNPRELDAFDWLANKHFLPNVWLGVSAEDQTRADERIPDLLATPAAVRFVSAESLLGPIDFTYFTPAHDLSFAASCHTGSDGVTRDDLFGRPVEGLDWIIVGGESGKGARPMHPQWARVIRDQCKAAGTAFFFKQNGEFASVSEAAGNGEHFHFPDGATVRRVGKRLAGRLLDGIEHNATPDTKP